MTERELDYERRIANQAKLIGERTRERDAASRLAAEYKESQVKLMRTLSQVQAERTAAYAERDELARKLEGAKAEGRREAFAEGVTEAQRDIYRWSGWYGFFKWLREKAACR
jgi:flagellar biosynthesis/type III secretory pathway protein FliH